MKFIKRLLGIIIIVILIGAIIVLTALLLKPTLEANGFYIEIRWNEIVWFWPTKPIQPAPNLTGWQNCGEYYIYYPATLGRQKDVFVWLAGSGEKGKDVLSKGLPKQAKSIDGIMVVPIKKTSNWNTKKTVDIINEALSEIEINGYEVKTLQGFGFSIGGQAIVKVAVSQSLRQQFNVVNILGITINGNDTREKLAKLTRGGTIQRVNFFIGDADKDTTRKGARADSQWLSNHCHDKIVNYTVIDNCGHDADKLTAVALGK